MNNIACIYAESLLFIIGEMLQKNITNGISNTTLIQYSKMDTVVDL